MKPSIILISLRLFNAVSPMLQEYDRDQLGQDNRDSDDEMGAGGTWQSVQIDSRPVDITTLPEKSVLDEEPVLNHGLAGALQLATKKGISSY